MITTMTFNRKQGHKQILQTLDDSNFKLTEDIDKEKTERILETKELRNSFNNNSK